MKKYRGHRDHDGVCHVTVNEPGRRARRLPWRTGLVNHSPTGLEWGYAGSGPAQTSLAILADALSDNDRAVRLHQAFKFRVIAGLARNTDWEMTIDEVVAHADALDRALVTS